MREYVTTHDDSDGVFSNWVIDGASRGNTHHGRLYARITQDADTTVSLYRDAGRTLLVAQGTLVGDDTGDVDLTEENDSGLSGSVHLNVASGFDATLDVFYADDADLTALQKDVAGFLVGGQFAGRPGFAQPLAQAKRFIDGLLTGLGYRRPDSLQPLADVAARCALNYIYEYLSTGNEDAASRRAIHWRDRAFAMLPAVRLTINGCPVRPFDLRVERA